jgi:hypothetical protein
MLSIIFAEEKEKFHLYVYIRYRLRMSILIITWFDRNTHRCKSKVASSLLVPKAFILLIVEIKLHLFWMRIFSNFFHCYSTGEVCF